MKSTVQNDIRHNNAREGHHRTIVTTDKRISVTICHYSVYVLLCLLEGDIHDNFMYPSRQDNTPEPDELFPGSRHRQSEHTTIVDTRCQADCNTHPNYIFRAVGDW
jgi:hypothetical protein